MKVLLVVYDNDSYIHWFPSNMGYLASALRNAGHEVSIYEQDIHHYPDSHLTTYLDNNKFDVIGVGVIAGYYQYRKIISISNAINASKNRPIYLIGGHGPSSDPEFYLNKTNADYVIRGEGEITIVELLECLSNKQSIENINGISYIINNEFKQTPDRDLICDLDTIAFPAYDLFDINIYRLIRFAHCDNNDFVMPLITSRGCIFKCSYCYRMDKGMRLRSAENIIKEIKFLQSNYGITYIYFFDELLMASKKRTIELCEAFIKSGLKFKWSCMGRLNFATGDVIKIMKDAGCIFINYGIECYDNQILKNMHKCLTVKQIKDGIENTIKHGISPGYNIIFGNKGENRETLQKGVDFLLKYDDGAQLRTIRPVTPYPGCELYYDAINEGKLDGIEDFYENKHTNSDLLTVNFTELSDEDYYDALHNANLQLLENYQERHRKNTIDQLDDLYKNKNSDFRGFRH